MIDFSKIKKLTIDGIDLKSLAINGVQVWKSGPKNWVKYSTEADGVTIYNGGLGYKDGYRVRSGGAEGEHESASCTGFIPFRKGDVLRIYPQFLGLNTQNAINYVNASFQNIGQCTGTGGYGICSGGNASQFRPTTDENGISVLHLVTNLADDVAYIRVTNQIAYASPYKPLITTGAEMVITVNEEIEL